MWLSEIKDKVSLEQVARFTVLIIADLEPLQKMQSLSINSQNFNEQDSVL